MSQKPAKSLPTPEVNELWNLILYKIEVLSGLKRRLKANVAIRAISDSLEQLNNFKKKYMNMYDALPGLQEHNRIVIFTIVNMLLRLGNWNQPSGDISLS
ncbi:MAG: hypothetical protein ACYDEJ_17365 [Desulfitobacteriaceae bacterium]